MTASAKEARNSVMNSCFSAMFQQVLPGKLGKPVTGIIGCLYAAMTRAKDQLHVLVPQRFFAHGRRRPRRSPRPCAVHALHS
jgi:hypothetical protein